MKNKMEEKKEKVICPNCGKKVNKEDLITEEDPFESEINGDHTVITQCEECYDNSMMEI